MRPERPRRLRRALVGRLRHDFELMNRKRLLAMNRPQAIGAGVAATDNDHALARRENIGGRIERIAVAALVLLREEFHCVVNSLQLASRNLQVTRMLGAAGQNDGIEFAAQIFDWNLAPNLSIGNELHALGRYLLEAAIDDVFFQLEFGNAVTQQSSDAVIFLINRNRMAGAAQLLRRRQSSRARADDGNFFSAAKFRRPRDGSSLRGSPRSTIFFSFCLIVTGGWLMPRTHEASQGAGQIRPVNSGKLLVACSCRTASFQRPR